MRVKALYVLSGDDSTGFLSFFVLYKGERTTYRWGCLLIFEYYKTTFYITRRQMELKIIILALAIVPWLLLWIAVLFDWMNKGWHKRNW